MTQQITNLLDRQTLRRLDARNPDGGELAEAIVREAYDLEPIDGDELEGDLRNPRTGARYEVKSTRGSVGSSYSNEGRFRLWEDQHRSAVGYDSQPNLTAWYVFVRFERDTPVELRRVEPSTVTQLVDADWNESGHDERDSRQHKLPLSEVFS